MGIKIAVLEKDGIEYGTYIEADLAQSIYEALLDQIRFDMGNFHIIPENKEMVINENKQIINYGGLTIDGQLEIRGNLVLQ